MNIQETILERAGALSGKSALTSEQVLVLQAKSGYSNAFGELYERHRFRIYRSAFRILRNRQDAEDVVQRSFQRAFTNLDRFRQKSAFSTWMTRIAINDALMQLRKRRITIPLSETYNDEVTSALDLTDEHPSPEQALAEDERRAAVTHAIWRLRESLRSVTLLRELQGLSNAETALRLGLTVGAVKTRVFRARRHLRQHLEHKVGRRPFLIELETQNSADLNKNANSEIYAEGELA